MERPPIRRGKTSPVGRTRPRSQSVWPTSTPSSALSATSLARSISYLPSPLPPSLITAATGTVESLDLPTSLPALVASLRAFLLGNVRQVEDKLRYLSEEFESSTEEDDDDALPADLDDGDRPNKGKGRQIIAPLPPADEVASGQMAQFVAQVRAYLRSLKADLFTAEQLPSPPDVARPPARERSRAASLSSADPKRPKLAYLGRSRSQSPVSTNALPTRSTISDVPTFCPSPTPLDEVLASPTVPSTFAIPDARHLLATLSAHSEKVQDLLAQVSLYCRTRSLSLPVTPSVSTAGPVLAAKRLLDSVPSFSSMSLGMPSRPPLPSPAVALGSYFAAESERLAQLVGPLHLAERRESVKTTLRAYRDEARSALHEGEERLREEKDRLKEWVEGEGERLKGWVDAEAEKFRTALRAGKERLLNYQELPIDWRNNEYILSGYRFIPAERWKDLLLSGVQWHNETVNIHTHLIGSISILYLLLAIWPSSPFSIPPSSTVSGPAQPDATGTDRLVALAFILCAFKCLVCSTMWHLFSGCASIVPFNRFACVDYVGISGLIAASVISTEYYGFYCRPGLASCYMVFSAAMGLLGMIGPFRSWFDQKPVRVTFFVSMACSSIIPALHMSALYGVRETVGFFRPILPSIACYLVGLFFYVTNYPEKIRPGGIFDRLFHSHSIWHTFVLGAIWLHWHALCSFHQQGRIGFSCARPDDHLWDKVVRAVADSSASSTSYLADGLGWAVGNL